MTAELPPLPQVADVPKEPLYIKAQEGPQSRFIRSRANIAIFGGAAGGGKRWGLLAEPLRHIHHPRFGGVIFRREATQIRNQGGLWDESCELYPLLGGLGSVSGLRWKFPSGARMRFAHLENEKDRFSWQGSQIPYIGFDELTHFTESQFFYFLSRNRSMLGFPGYIRASTNPLADSWVAKFIEWWIDQRTGYPIPERDGVIRWMVMNGNDRVWGNSSEELIAKFGPESMPKSVTFIRARVTDNKILLAKDPQYLANLKALPYVDRMQLLEGNWMVRPAAGNFFKRRYFTIVKDIPRGLIVRTVRCWDRAATKPLTPSDDPDWTCGVKVSIDRNGVFYVEHVERMRDTPLQVDLAMKVIASQDGPEVEIGIFEDPGAAGKGEAQATVRRFAGSMITVERATKDKVTQAKAASAQAEAGNIRIVEGPWNEEFIRELENFPEGPHDDQVDPLGHAIRLLTTNRSGDAEVIQNREQRGESEGFRSGGWRRGSGSGTI